MAWATPGPSPSMDHVEDASSWTREVPMVVVEPQMRELVVAPVKIEADGTSGSCLCSWGWGAILEGGVSVGVGSKGGAGTGGTAAGVGGADDDGGGLGAA